MALPSSPPAGSAWGSKYQKAGVWPGLEAWPALESWAWPAGELASAQPAWWRRPWRNQREQWSNQLGSCSQCLASERWYLSMLQPPCPALRTGWYPALHPSAVRPRSLRGQPAGARRSARPCVPAGSYAYAKHQSCESPPPLQWSSSASRDNQRSSASPGC
jgi:hypothetical protein